MSDHTTEATDHMPSGVEPGNPSMEDILASIRRIIADDDAPKPSVPETASLETNLNALAATSPEARTQDELVLDVETPPGDDDIMDLEDILILDEEDFSDDTLEIPNMDMELTSLELDTVEDTSSFLSDEIEAALETTILSDLDTVILDTPDIETDTTLIEPVVTPESDEISLEMPLTDPLIDNVFEAVEDVVSEEPSDPALDDDIFSALESDLDLVLDQPLASDDSTAEDFSESGMAAVLNVIDEDISNIEIPENEREQAAIEIEAILDGEDTDSESLDDLMASLLSDSITEPDSVDDAPIHVEDEMPVSLTEPEMTDVMAGSDIELVKSLMADLTESDSLTEPTTDAALLTPEISDEDTTPITELSPERDAIDDVLDDIFEMSMEDEEIILDAPDDPGVESVDASISSLLKIAAEVEQDAKSFQGVTSEPEIPPETTPEIAIDSVPPVLDIMPTVDEALPVETPEEDLGSLFDDSLISAVETESKDINEDAEVIVTEEPETATPSLAIEALAAQTLAIEDLLQADDVTTDETESIDPLEALSSPETLVPEDALPAPSVEDAILPEPEPEAEPEAELVENVTPEPIIEPETETHQEPEPEAQLTPDPAPAPKEETIDMTEPAVKSDSILDEVTETAASDAFASLNQLVEAQTVFEESGPRIGDLVQEALRPMLKEWLDEHLKGIVERAVQKEVKRISSGK